MNLVNLTTAIHRLAKFVAHDLKAQAYLKQVPVLSDVLVAIANVLAGTGTKDIQPQSLSNILWALASMRHVDQQVIALACRHILPNIYGFKLFELSTMLWAVAKLGTVDPSIHVNIKVLKQIYDEAAKYIIENVETMEFRCLSMVAWAYATAKQMNPGLFTAIATQMTLGARDATSQEMANTIWAFGTLNIFDEDLFHALAEKAITMLAQFKAQELSNMLWGFASVGYFHDQFYELAADATRAKELSAQHLANILWAFSRVRAKHPLTQRTILSALPLCCRQMHSFKAQELSSVALSVAKAFTNKENEQPQPFPQEVIDFFTCIPKALPGNLANFSTQSLTNMASAFSMIDACNSEGLFNLFGQEAIHRAVEMEPGELLRILPVFLGTPGVQGNYAGVFAIQISNRLGQFRTRDLRQLSRTFIEYFDLKRGRDLTRQELCECCDRVARMSAWTGDGSTPIPMQPLSFQCALKFEVASNGETEEVSTTLSELSENVEADLFQEDLESSRLVSDTEHRLSQVADSPTAADYVHMIQDCNGNVYTSSQMQLGLPQQWLSPSWCAMQGGEMYGTVYSYDMGWDASGHNYYYQEQAPLRMSDEDYATDDGF
eukprot:CAMPEP_0169103772 /NCGR_PEP_ID=MMETSP1015-20121227/22901_1 /TAXON_ID=342587 /ORGANISM="Karlodinium micrum, Strain CCMP2283" /LENGTH=605 /DNA_ID=CAMNT_0009165007 /DNA_START=346 /DNA_END=2163 /DNA_ORIENTATION=-